jgi:hypothetical protein
MLMKRQADLQERKKKKHIKNVFQQMPFTDKKPTSSPHPAWGHISTVGQIYFFLFFRRF